jgi:chromosomal replication initiation ATPase DnaA
MSTLNEKEVLKIQVHNLRLALRRKEEQLSKIKEEYTNELQKIKKDYGIKLLHLRITLSPRKELTENVVPLLCNILHSVTGVSSKEILSKSRKRDYIIPRYVIIHMLRLEGKTLQFIGKTIGNQHHSTIIHAIKVVEDWHTYPEYYKKEIEIYNKTKKMFEEVKN